MKLEETVLGQAFTCTCTPKDNLLSFHAQSSCDAVWHVLLWLTWVGMMSSSDTVHHTLPGPCPAEPAGKCIVSEV